MNTGEKETTIPLRLMRLTSTLLPVGAFAYSRGLEYAHHAGWVNDAEQLQDWVFGTMQQSFATLDGAVYLRMHDALDQRDTKEFEKLDAFLSASRESQELLLEDRRMAESLLGVLNDFDVAHVTTGALRVQTFPGAYAIAVHDLDVAAASGLCGLLWTVCEAQVAAAIRLGIIGQTDGQKVLSDAPQLIEKCVDIAQGTSDESLGNVSFMMAVGSALHETQYSRLFRS